MSYKDGTDVPSRVLVHRDECGQLITRTYEEAIDIMGALYKKENEYNFWFYPDKAIADYKVRFGAWVENLK